MVSIDLFDLHFNKQILLTNFQIFYFFLNVGKINCLQPIYLEKAMTNLIYYIFFFWVFMPKECI